MFYVFHPVVLDFTNYTRRVQTRVSPTQRTLFDSQWRHVSALHRAILRPSIIDDECDTILA
jgi:hypothetical protein